MRRRPPKVEGEPLSGPWLVLVQYGQARLAREDEYTSIVDACAAAEAAIARLSNDHIVYVVTKDYEVVAWYIGAAGDSKA